jgi:hypothetical protein
MTETQKTNTAVAQAAQAAVNVQLAHNASHFPNPREVDLERVSFCLLFTVITTKFVTNMSFCHYWTKGHGRDANSEHFASANTDANELCQASRPESATPAFGMTAPHL